MFSVEEALAYRRAATRSNVLLNVPEATMFTEGVSIVVTAARTHGVSVVAFGDPTDYSTWDELASAERSEPDPAQLDAFIEAQLPTDVRRLTLAVH